MADSTDSRKTPTSWVVGTRILKLERPGAHDRQIGPAALIQKTLEGAAGPPAAKTLEDLL